MSPDLVLLALAAVAGAAIAALASLARRQTLVRQNARLEAELDAARRAADDQRAALTATDARLREAFAALSRDALKENAATFLQTADLTLRGRQEAIDALLAPVRDSLDKVQAQMASVDKEREGSYRAVAQQLSAVAQSQELLRHTTDTLSRALRSPNVRGKWGEIQLRKIVELAGMLEQCDFVEKESVTTDTGARQTPDLIVRLPGGATVVVDAKVPIDGYLQAVNAIDDAARQQGLAAHARQVRDHVRALGAREYWNQFQPSPKFVVMFLPIEPLLAAAFEQDGKLLEQAASLGVIPATPMTLLALLRAVALGWQQQHLAENAEEIRQIGRDLYDRLATMVEHLERVGSNLKQAADSYDRFIGSLEQKVLPGVRRFKELGVNASKELGDPEPLRLSVRRLSKPELTGADTDAEVVEAETAPLLAAAEDE